MLSFSFWVSLLHLTASFAPGVSQRHSPYHGGKGFASGRRVLAPATLAKQPPCRRPRNIEGFDAACYFASILGLGPFVALAVAPTRKRPKDRICCLQLEVHCFLLRSVMRVCLWGETERVDIQIVFARR